MFGTHQYMWQSKFYRDGSKRENSYELVEKVEWFFGKGFRDFWGMPELDFGFLDINAELRLIGQLIGAMDRSLEGLPAKFRILENEEGELELLGSSNGFKKFISSLLKHYVNLSLEGTNGNQSLKYNKIEPLTDQHSPKKIIKVSMPSSHRNIKWIDEIIDWAIDQKK